MIRTANLAIAFCVVSSTAFAWEVRRSVSPVDDSVTVVALQDADGGYTNRMGQTGRATIQIGCEQNTTILALLLPGLYTSSVAGKGRVTMRVDKDPAFTVSMEASNDHGALMQIGGKAIVPLKRMVGGSSLFVRFVTVNEPATDAVFDLSDIDEAIGAVREACDW